MPYTGKIRTEYGYYIHHLSVDVGSAEGGSNKESFVSMYQKQKTNVAWPAAKNYFKSMFKANLRSDAQGLLSDVFERDDLMSELNKQMAEGWSSMLNIKNVRLGIEANRSVADIQFDSLFDKNNFSDSIKKAGWEDFDALLTAYIKTVSLLDTSGMGGELIIALTALKNGVGGANKTWAKLGTELKSKLAGFVKGKDFTTIEARRVLSAVDAMNSIADALITKKIKKGKKDLTKEGFKTLIDKTFSTNIGEALGTMISSSAKMMVDQELIKMTGSETTKIQFTDEYGNPITEELEKNRPYMGKVDYKAENVKFMMDGSIEGKTGEINFNIGVSNKAYRANKVPGFPGSNSNAFSSGSGGMLSEAIKSIFGAGAYRQIYYAYNTIAHGSERKEETEALNDLILTRQFNRLFVTRGGAKDFAQFIVLNGEVVPLWNVLMLLEKSMGKSNSQRGSGNQPVTLSIPGRPAIETAAKFDGFRGRVFAVNKLIGTTKIQAEIHLDKLKQIFNAQEMAKLNAT